jgi:hypothetical protein
LPRYPQIGARATGSVADRIRKIDTMPRPAPDGSGRATGCAGARRNGSCEDEWRRACASLATAVRNASRRRSPAASRPGLRADLRFEYIDRDQPRSGTQNVAVGEIPRHHDEV